MIRTYMGETDNRRKEIMWLALALLAAFGITLFLALYAGFAVPLQSYDDIVMTFGLPIVLGCAIAYLAGKEREQRHLNQSLVASLHGAVRELNERVATIDELTAANGELSAVLETLRQELGENYLRALRALMTTLDARDDYTAVHSEQVTTIAVKIATRMGLERCLIDLLKRFGPLHDIGKIGIPDGILHRTEPLDASALELCHRHPSVGAAIVAPLRPRPEALAIVRAHHERWDGSGYPDGLAGTDTALLARIVGVADAYHALISRRPYRPAREPEQAVREMMAAAGSQFDPNVVGVLAQLVVESVLDARGTP